MAALMTVGELARVLAASAVPTEMEGDGRAAFSSVSTDSRTLAAGALFVALSGERFDGHDYVSRERRTEQSRYWLSAALPSTFRN